MTSQLEDTRYWFTIRCSYGSEKKAYEYFVGQGIKAFYPTLRSRLTNVSQSIERESLIPNIFFAYGSFDQLKALVYDNVHDETKNIRFYYNKHHDGSKEPLIIPESQMHTLMLICESDVDDILVKPFTVEKFVKGQRVLVKEGPFAGVEGIVARFQGQQRVGISVEGVITVVTAYVPSAFLESIDNISKNY